MKVILLKDIDNVGEAGEIKEVADGYSRNFLLPRRLAEIANKQNIKKWEKKQEQKAKTAEQDLLATEKMAEKLEGVTVDLEVKVNESGKLYAAVTTSLIAKKLKEKDFEIKKDQIALLEPIKEVGEYPVTINLDHGLEAEIVVIVGAAL